MVRVKGGEWLHVTVVKEPAKHGMAWHVKCAHCGKAFQGNAMRIRAHLLGHPDKALGCAACPDEAREQLRLSYLAKSQHLSLQRKNKKRQSSSRCEEKRGSVTVFRNGFLAFSPIKSLGPDVTDLEFFLDGFGIRAETINKIKEMGFTGKTFMSNLDELRTLVESIKQHCHLTLGEEWGIKGAAKKWQKEHGVMNPLSELEKWPDPETKSAPACKEEVLNHP